MVNQKKIKILVVGAGMFVSGRGANNYGTVLPAVCNEYVNGNISEIILASTNVQSANYAKKIVLKINKIFNKKIIFKSFPEKKNNKKEYLKIAKTYKPDAAIISVPDHLHYEILLYNQDQLLWLLFLYHLLQFYKLFLL